MQPPLGGVSMLRESATGRSSRAAVAHSQRQTMTGKADIRPLMLAKTPDDSLTP